MMNSRRPVIVQASINGSSAKQNGRFPRTPEEIAETALNCIQLGASIIHNHIDLSKSTVEEAVSRYKAGWQIILERCPDALLFPTIHFDSTSGKTNFEHIEPLVKSGLLRLSFCDVGSVCFVEDMPDGLPHGATIYGNSLTHVTSIMDLYRRLAIGVIVNVYDFTGLRHFLFLHQAGRAPHSAIVNLYLARDPNPDGQPTFVGLPPSRAAILLCVDMLKGSGLPWSVTLFGGDLIEDRLAGYVLEMGGHLTVGLETYGGHRHPSNEELVSEAGDFCRAYGLRTATPEETADLLHLPQRGGVGTALQDRRGLQN